MQRILFFFLILAAGGCSTLEPAERTAQVPNIPVEKKDCDSPLGYIEDGQTVAGFLNEYEPPGRSCQAGVLTCHDGIWSGEFVHPKCTPAPLTP